MPAPSDLVHETSTSTGTGNLTTANVNGKRSFNTAFGTGGADVFDYFISNRDAAEWERGTGHLSAATTLVRDTVIASSNSNNAVNFSAGTKDVTSDIPAASQAVLEIAILSQFPQGFDAPINLGLSATVSGNDLTVAIKGANGSDPSATNPVYIPFRSATATTGTPVWRKLTSALSVVVPDDGAGGAGGTLGTTNGAAFRLVVGVFDDGGTLRLGVINATSIGINEGAVASSTTVGTGSDSVNTWYSDTGVTSKAFRILGYLDFPSGQTTAGVWAAAPTTTQLHGEGVVPQVITPPKVTVYTSGSGTHTTATGCRWMVVQLIGAGGGGCGSGGAGATSGGTGGDTTFGSLTGSGGTGGASNAGGTGGAASGGDVNQAGGAGNYVSNLSGTGCPGGNGVYGGAGCPAFSSAGTAGSTNSGAGGAGGWFAGTGGAAGGGASGGFVQKRFALPDATYSYAVGAAGTAGSAGSSGNAGGAGAAGRILVTEYFT